MRAGFLGRTTHYCVSWCIDVCRQFYWRKDNDPCLHLQHCNSACTVCHWGCRKNFEVWVVCRGLIELRFPSLSNFSKYEWFTFKESFFSLTHSFMNWEGFVEMVALVYLPVFLFILTLHIYVGTSWSCENWNGKEIERFWGVSLYCYTLVDKPCMYRCHMLFYLTQSHSQYRMAVWHLRKSTHTCVCVCVCVCYENNLT